MFPQSDENKYVDRIVDIFMNRFTSVDNVCNDDEEIRKEIESEVYKIVVDIYERGWTDAQ